jgi:hypothetical protein
MVLHVRAAALVVAERKEVVEVRPVGDRSIDQLRPVPVAEERPDDGIALLELRVADSLEERRKPAQGLGRRASPREEKDYEYGERSDQGRAPRGVWDV